MTPKETLERLNKIFICESCYQKSVANIAKARTCVKNRKPLIFGKLINGRNQDA